MRIHTGISRNMIVKSSMFRQDKTARRAQTKYRAVKRSRSVSSVGSGRFSICGSVDADADIDIDQWSKLMVWIPLEVLTQVSRER